MKCVGPYSRRPLENLQDVFAVTSAEWIGGRQTAQVSRKRLFTGLLASSAESGFRPTATITGSSARRAAMPNIGEEALRMDAKMRTRISRFRAAMSLAREMLRQGVITADEYGIITTILTKRYGINSCTIFQDITGYYTDSEVISD